MTTDLVRYDLLVQDALRNVVQRVLGDAARDGLPGDHHFYISFRTDRPGVRISSRLRERYPKDMTIVLQHQFDNLTVNEHGFEVGLSFSGIAERLRIPFAALTGFFDPSVQFGLKFEEQQEGAVTDEMPPSEDQAASGGAAEPQKLLPPGRGDPKTGKKPGGRKLKPVEAEAEASAEVVSLDAFRKKS